MDSNETGLELEETEQEEKFDPKTYRRTSTKPGIYTTTAEGKLPKEVAAKILVTIKDFTDKRTIPLVFPNGGEIIFGDLVECQRLMGAEDLLRARRQLHADGFAWHHDGRHTYQIPEYFMTLSVGKWVSKDESRNKNPDFIRWEFVDENYKKDVLIYYQGNSSKVARGLVHGNRKKPGPKYFQQLPSMIYEAKQKSLEYRPHELYNELTKTTENCPEKNIVGIPRNHKTIYNAVQSATRAMKQPTRLSPNTFTNVWLQMTYLKFEKTIEILDTTSPNDFVFRISLEDQHFSIGLHCPPLIDELKKCAKDKVEPIKLFYDSTIQFYNYHVSILSFWHHRFRKQVPIAMHLHDGSNTMNLHYDFFNRLCEIHQVFQKASFILVTSEEYYFENLWTNVRQAHCYSYIEKNFKDEMEQYLPKTIVNSMITKMKILQRQTTYEKFDNYLETWMEEIDEETQNQTISDYIEIYADKIRKWSSFAYLKTLNCSYNYLSTNQAETIKNIFKGKISIQSLPDEFITSSFCELMKYINWIIEGYYHDGKFCLAADFKYLMKKSTNNEEIVVNLPLIPENYEITDYIRKQNGIPSKQSLINFQNVSTGEGIRNFIATTIFQTSEIYEVHTENDTTRRWIIINNNKEILIVKKDKFKCSCPIEEDCIHIKALHLKLMADNPDQYNQHLPDPGSQDIFALQKKLGNKNRKRVNGLEYVMVNNQPSRKKSRIPNQTEEEIVDILDE